MRLLIKKSNKGAALVSIMVAVAFLSIIATTLLAISLNNYEMKSVQTKSNMNFYNNEKYLNVVTTNLRSSVYEQTDPKAVLAAAVGGDLVLERLLFIKLQNWLILFNPELLIPEILHAL